MLVVTLNGGKTYSLPIVVDLKANIVDPEKGFKDGVWTIGYGETVKLKWKFLETIILSQFLLVDGLLH